MTTPSASSTAQEPAAAVLSLFVYPDSVCIQQPPSFQPGSTMWAASSVSTRPIAAADSAVAAMPPSVGPFQGPESRYRYPFSS